MDASLYTSCLVVSSLCSQVVRSADSVLPMGLQSLSAFPVLCQLYHNTHTPWAYCEVWLQAYTFALVSCWRTFQGTDTPCSCQKMPLDNSTCAGLWHLQTRWIPRSGSSPDGPSFSLCSTFCPFLSFGQEHFWFKNFEVIRWSHSFTYGLEVISTGSISPFLCILATVNIFRSWMPLSSLASLTLQCCAFIEW